jgi:pyruvate formate lyase activating enzyme
MIIDGFNKLTLLDYPGHLSAIIFTRGCNFKCPFCQNSSLVLNKSHEKGNYSEDEVLAYLKKRQGILQGIVISGGEPTIQKNLKDFIKNVKKLRYDVKLDTNGSNPNLLRELIDEKLIDYVAMDIKNSFLRYSETAGKKIVEDKIKESIKILKENKIDFEFRTTISKELHDYESIKKICEYIGKDTKYFLQNYNDSDTVLQRGLHGFTDSELEEFRIKLIKDFPKIEIR